jgi:hypothetical protein
MKKTGTISADNTALETEAQIGKFVSPIYYKIFRTRSRKIHLGVLKRWRIRKVEKLVQFMRGAQLPQLRDIFKITNIFYLSLCTDKECQVILQLLKDGRFDQNPAFQESGLRTITVSCGRMGDRKTMLKNLLMVPADEF